MIGRVETKEKRLKELGLCSFEIIECVCVCLYGGGNESSYDTIFEFPEGYRRSSRVVFKSKNLK